MTRKTADLTDVNNKFRAVFLIYVEGYLSGLERY